jgi:cysteine synthase B
MQTMPQLIGNTPLVALSCFPLAPGAQLLAKMESQNPGGSVKDRPAFNMLWQAQQRGEIKPGDTLIEATSGNTGIALALVSALLGYRMILIMPENMSAERIAMMRAYGAEIHLVTAEASMEGARDLALAWQAAGRGKVLDQFSNPDNPDAHYRTTGPELWQQTAGTITHFVSAMGTTGTMMGVSRYLKEKNPSIQMVGVQPAEGAKIPGIRRWPAAYLPKIFDHHRVDHTVEVSQAEAEAMSRRLARAAGIFCGISAGGAAHIAAQVAATTPNAQVVFIVCDRGERYLSTGVFP